MALALAAAPAFGLAATAQTPPSLPPVVQTPASAVAPSAQAPVVTEGGDVIAGTDGPDTLDGLGGADTINGRDGADLIRGGEGPDLLNGNAGSDTVDGGPGPDTLFGGRDSDSLAGGPGDDRLSGDLGDDTLSGGPGADRFVVRPQSGADVVTDFSSAEGDRIELPPGTTYTLSEDAAGVTIHVSSGEQLQLSGVRQAAMGDWLAPGQPPPKRPLSFVLTIGALFVAFLVLAGIGLRDLRRRRAA